MSEVMTVFSDASFSGGKAGWAAWAKYRGDVLRMSAGITFPVSNISPAETIAICSAIIRCVRHFGLESGSIIVAQSDSTDALGALLWAAVEARHKNFVRIASTTDVRPSTPRTVKGDAAEFARRVLRLLVEKNITVYVKHVRAHTGKDEPRSHVNAWCDAQAKREMRAVRHQCAEKMAEVGSGNQN